MHGSHCQASPSARLPRNFRKAWAKNAQKFVGMEEAFETVLAGNQLIQPACQLIQSRMLLPFQQISLHFLPKLYGSFAEASRMVKLGSVSHGKSASAAGLAEAV